MAEGPEARQMVPTGRVYEMSTKDDGELFHKDFAHAGCGTIYQAYEMH